MRHYYVYVMANESRMLYIGVTNDLERRVVEHKEKLVPGYTSRYNITRLVHYEVFDDVNEAIAREKKLKGWRRSRKQVLIEASNSRLQDLAAQWGT